jgi:hypothetical protein
MPRPYRNRRRRRPGRRPPDRHSGGHGPPAGFTPPGLDSFYRVALPGLAGCEKREFFNGISRWLVAGFGLGGVVLGFCALGPLGALLGLAGGLAASGRVAVKGRFHRG